MEFLSEIIRRDKFIIETGYHTRDAIIIVLSGQFECVIQGKAFCAKPGDICVFHGGTLFERHVLQPIRCVYLQFEPFPMALPAGILETADPLRTANTVKHLADAVMAEDRLLTEHFIRDILLLHRSEATDISISDPIVAGCIRIFEQRYSAHIALEELAQQFSISKQGLIQKFRRLTDKTPMEYLAAVRLARSKQLLRDTILPIGEVAQRCGFENVYYFSNFFKRMTGVRPSVYRKLNDL